MVKNFNQAGFAALFSILIFVVMASGSLAGDLEPATGPDESGSAMFTLEDLYNRLNTGAPGEKRTGGFADPASAPGSTGHTIDEIVSRLPAADDAEGALPGDVAAGKTFWGLRTDGTWGPQVGTSITCAGCTGTLSPGGRWCDQGDGTVKDMTTNLVWLKDASWGGRHQFYYYDGDTKTALDRAADARNGTPSSLTDGSEFGEWRLPTKSEFDRIVNGTEPVSSGTPRAFTGLQGMCHWSSTSASGTDKAWVVIPSRGAFYNNVKDADCYVWPVRGDY